jgi:hypothetical protein
MEDKFLLLKTSTGKEYKLKKISCFDKEKILEKMYKIIENDDKDGVIWLSAVDIYENEKERGFIDSNIVKKCNLDPNLDLKNEDCDDTEDYKDIRLEDLYYEQIQRISAIYYEEIENEVFYYLQEKDITDNLKSLDYWYKNGRKPKNKDCIISLFNYIEDYITTNDCYKEYCFVEDTVQMSEDEREYFSIKDEFKTAWQWLAQDRRKVKDKAIPIYKLNRIYDDFTQEFYQEDKEYYYYKGIDTEKVEDKEYNKLKDLYIKEFGGWEKIDLENTEYNGKKWY